MKQLVLETPGKFSLRDVEPPGAPGEGEVLVKVRRVGICGTDLHAYEGVQPFFDYPRVLGHELAVEVVESGPGVSGFGPGDLCAVEPYLYDGDDQASKRGKTNCAHDLLCLGVRTDGAMSEYFTLPADK